MTNSLKVDAEAVFECDGEGILLDAMNEEIPCPFTFIQNEDGSMLLTCTVSLDVFHQSPRDRFEKAKRFCGRTQSGLLLECDRIFFGGTHQQYEVRVQYHSISSIVNSADSHEIPDSIRFAIVNLNLIAESYADFRLSDELIVEGPQTPLTAGDVALTLKPLPNITEIINRLKQNLSIAPTCIAISSITDWENCEVLEDTMTTVCGLLTFMYGTHVNWVGYEVLSKTGAILRRVCHNRPVSGYASHIADQSWAACVWTHDQSVFIANAFERFESLWDNWDIFAAINLFIDVCGQVGYAEFAGLQYASCIEIIVAQYLLINERKKITPLFDKKIKPKLKDTVTESIRQLISSGTENTKIGQDSEIICDLIIGNLPNLNHYPFGLALNEICKHFDFAPGKTNLERFTKNRNSLVHTGLFAISYEGRSSKRVSARQRWDAYGLKAQERSNELHFMQDFVGKLLLAALGRPHPLAGW